MRNNEIWTTKQLILMVLRGETESHFMAQILKEK